MGSVPASTPLEGECALLTAPVRANASVLDALLADDFFEIAASSASFTKDEVLARLFFHQGTPLPDGDTIRARRFAGNQ